MKNNAVIYTLIIFSLMFFSATETIKAVEPSNDNLSSAMQLSLQSGTVSGSNIGASREAGEPNHYDSNLPGAKTVWYKWTPLSSFTAQLELTDNFSSTIAVYSTTSGNPTFAQLTKINTASNADFNGYTEQRHRVKFFAEVGKTYYIAIGGYALFSSATEGTFQLKYGRNRFRYSTDFETRDDKASLSVFRPSTGIWYNLQNSTSNPFEAIPWGTNGDSPVSADYDGDGETDIAVARNVGAVKNWYIYGASNAVSFQWGIASDKAVVGEFDGDGRADIVAIRNHPEGSYWHIRQSSNGALRSLFFGKNLDKPVLGDFDGDGLTDPTVVRNFGANRVWYTLKSSTNYTQFTGQQFGNDTDVPAAEDFDGDGKTDIAVFRPSNGHWYVLRSSDNQFQAQHFGSGGDKPQPADYDGDGKADFTVFRPSTGAWYILRSGNNEFYAKQWGAQTDVPFSTLAAISQ
ncbi:MAG: VCBS repeat-containing protein [Acidobacteriota bacterium]|nr:VCBS repeat-containing protein [Acidobacteriota bacterium]